MKILFATSNQGKLSEAKAVLEPLGLEVVPFPLSLIETDAGTVKEVALQKIKQAMEQGYDQVMVDDAGIYFAAYHQFPGVLTKRIFNGIGYRGIAKLLAGENREAWFEGTVAVCWKGQVQTFSGITKGHIIDPLTEDIQPVPGFPFDSVFIPEGEHHVLKDLPMEKRLFYSYRRKALEKMAHWLFLHEKKNGQQDTYML
ncbi:non-canonical purine NTP pyrophosphatase [Thermoflavimicrobium dichotomicum]|uniref:XTP/dITP diphosphohydrolase n=1 Tax=Thermoflavimicrobium dichotomicum TaxID=46223 RepID=A0A1I3JTA6_9BACL|nr:non-canonical purine NTP pyrophosphatase [Thermoflavimicrobium dichotomicum]SFI63497.1 XTP/dITP diphosphohydrolase [Thermoflavimicrobium dichotomicum]